MPACRLAGKKPAASSAAAATRLCRLPYLERCGEPWRQVHAQGVQARGLHGGRLAAAPGQRRAPIDASLQVSWTASETLSAKLPPATNGSPLLLWRGTQHTGGVGMTALRSADPPAHEIVLTTECRGRAGAYAVVSKFESHGRLASLPGQSVGRCKQSTPPLKHCPVSIPALASEPPPSAHAGGHCSGQSEQAAGQRVAELQRCTCRRQDEHRLSSFCSKL